MKKKFFLLTFCFISFTFLLNAEKRCGCDEGGVAYKWFVPDGGHCEDDASGQAVRQDAKSATLVEVSEALDFCFPKK